MRRARPQNSRTKAIGGGRWIALALVYGLLVLLAACRPADAPTATGPVAIEETIPAAPSADTTPSDAIEAVEDTPQRGNSLAAGDHTMALRHGRRDRSYIVHVPDREPGPVAVMIALHGGGGTGAGFQDQNGLDAIADREGFVAVYPEGTGILPNRLHTWNSGDSCCGFALDRDIDDVGFLRAVIRDLAAHHTDIDLGRVYMTGHSNGAMMAYRFAAEAGDMVTAIVPVGGAVDVEVSSIDAPVAVLHIHSVDDPRALYQGGQGPPFPGTDRAVHHEPVLPGIERWAALNGCQPTPMSSEPLIGSGSNDGHTLSTLTWSGCEAGISVEHYVLTGSGHGWPGIEVGRAVQRHLGPPTTLLSASEAAWAFASQFER